MRLTDLMESTQLDELGIGDTARAAWQGLKAGGISGAKTGYTGEKLKQAGANKADLIVKDLKQQFMGLVGGSGQSTSAQLKTFLSNSGLTTTSIPRMPANQTLDNLAIDKILRDVVRANYQAIIAAQGGVTSIPPTAPAAGIPPIAPPAGPIPPTGAGVTTPVYKQATTLINKLSVVDQGKILKMLQKKLSAAAPSPVPPAPPGAVPPGPAGRRGAPPTVP